MTRKSVRLAGATLPEAYDLASEVHNFGADAAELLRPQPDPRRPRNVTIPVMLSDVIMAVFLALPRPEWAPDQPLERAVFGLNRGGIPESGGF
jgi:hypothetical protein